MHRGFEEISDEEWSNHTFKPSRVLKRPNQRPSRPPPPIDSFAYNPKACSAAGTSTATVVLSDDDSDFDLGADGGSRRAAKSQRVLKRPHNGPPSRPSPPVKSFRRNPQPSNVAAAFGVSESEDDDFVLTDDDFDRPTSSLRTSSLRRKGKSQRPLKGPQLKPHLRAPPPVNSFSHNAKRSKFATDVGLSNSEDDEFDLTESSSLHRSAKRQPVQKRPQHKPRLQDPQSYGSPRHNPKPSKAAATTGLSDSDDDDFNITDTDVDLPASLSRTSRPRRTTSRRLTSFAIDISEEDEEDLADDDFDYQDPRPPQQRPSGRRFVIGDDDDSDVPVAVDDDDDGVNWSELEKEDEDEGYNGERNVEEPEGDVVGMALRKCSHISSDLRKELFGSSARDCESYAEIDASTCRIVTQEDVNAACTSEKSGFEPVLKPYQLVGVNFLLLLHRKSIGGGEASYALSS